MKILLLVLLFIFSYTNFAGISNRRWYIAGTFSTVYNTDGSAVSSKNFAEWNGTAWATTGTDVNGDVNALFIDPCKNVYVGGAFTSVGGVSTG
jgi:hypothetical protein